MKTPKTDSVNDVRPNIIESNRLIADFMGLKPTKFGTNYQWSDSPHFFVNHDTHEKVMESIANYSKYDTSWDWLIPVVEKIESISGQFWIGKYSTSVTSENVRDWEISSGKGLTKIQSVYVCAVRFITWYNEQTNKNEK